ncbi:MAG: hypothetical protein QM727_00685 [Niabella sp.]
MKKNILYIFIVFSLVSCSGRLLFTGKYASKDSPYGFYINPDSTFSYKFYQFHEYEYSNGKWFKKDKYLILNSNLRDITIPLVIKDESILSGDSLNNFSFEFVSSGLPAKDCECAIVINDTSKQIRRCDSIALVEITMPVHNLFVEVRKSPLLMTSLRFSLHPLVTNTYIPKKEYGNSANFKIIVNDSLFSYKIFNNKKLKISKRGLYYYNEKGRGKYWIPKLNE